MDVSYGYEGNAKSGRYVPVNFSLKNQMDSEFQGTVQAIAMESDYDIYQYEYPVSLKAFEARRNPWIFRWEGQMLFM